MSIGHFLAIAIVVTTVCQANDFTINLGRGAVLVNVPPGYDPQSPAPLVILLHGYSASGAIQESYMQFTPLSDAQGFVYMYPDGTIDAAGNRFWNATDSCCDFYGTNVNDVAYIKSLIDEVRNILAIDNRRIHLIGHSNGGFMSYRMSCEYPFTIASMASLAGATYADADLCNPASPVHVLQIHGTDDTLLFYGGGALLTPYPGAVETVEQWAGFAACSLVPDTSHPELDLDTTLPGDDTTVASYETDCHSAGSGTLWTIHGGGHVPFLSPDFTREVINYLYNHPKPDRCIANWNADIAVNTGDFIDYLNDYNAVVGGASPVFDDPDLAKPYGVLNTADFVAFLNGFAAGCL